MPPLRIALLLFAFIPIAGCGSGGDAPQSPVGAPTEEERVLDAMEAVFAAGNARDFEAYCRLLTGPARDYYERIAKRRGLPEECPAGLESQGGGYTPSGVEALGAEINDTRATVEFRLTLPGAGKPRKVAFSMARAESGEWKFTNLLAR